MEANPVAAREFMGILRSKRALAVLLASAVVLTALVVLRWPSSGLVGMSGEASRQVFRIFGYGMLSALLLLAPAFPATSIVRERNSGTLALLLNSPLSPWAIYLGKAAGVLGFFAVLFCVSLPAATACYAMGGVALVQQFLMLYVVLTLVAVQITAVALLVSTISTTADGALRITYGVVFGYTVLALIPQLFVQGKSPSDFAETLTNYGVGSGLAETLSVWPGRIAWLLRNASPITMVTQVMGDGQLGSQGAIASSGVWYIPIAVASVAVMAWATITRLDFRLFDRARSQGVITDDLSSGRQWLRRLLFLVDPQRRSSGIAWFMNPVTVKELRTRRFGRLHWLLRLVFACAIASLALTLATMMGIVDQSVEVIGGIMVVLQVMLIVAVTPSLAAGLISGERESGGWELLQATPLSVVSILLGKLLSVAGTLLLLLLATLPGYVVMIVIQPVMLFQVQRVLLTLAWSALFCMVISAAISSYFRRTAAATATAYAVLAAIFAGTLLVWMGRDNPFGFETVRAALLINPMAVALSIVGAPGFAEYNLAPLGWWIAGLGSLAAMIALCVQTWRVYRPA